MRVAIVYDRVNKFGGAERVLLALHEILPKAPLYTSVYSEKNAKWAKVFPAIHTSFLQAIPFAKNNHEFFPFLMPLAFSLFNFDKYDLVISVTSEFAKNITVKNGKHICYCLTPTRYLWSHEDEYINFKFKIFNQFLKFLIINWLKKVDLTSSKKPDVIVSISHEIQSRVKKYYRRDSEIIYPPVDTNNLNFKNFKLNSNFKFQIKNYYLVVSRLVSYKKVDLAIKAFNKLGHQLIIVGSGREERKLRKIANKNIKFAGFVSERELISLYSHAKALVFPQEEDFGITAVEAQSFGVPVIAYKKGGALDTVVDKKTGIFFEKQTVNGLKKAIQQFNNLTIEPSFCIKNAKRFSKQIFRKQFLELTKNLC